MKTKLSILSLLSLSIAFSLAPNEFYCIQVASSRNPEELKKIIKFVSTYPDIRIEKIGDIYTLRVGFFKEPKKARQIEKRLKGSFKDAFLRVCAYRPERVVFPDFRRKAKGVHNYEVGIKLARLYIKKKEFGKAEEVYRQLLSLYPDDREIKLMLARVLFWQGKYDEAIRLYKEVEMLDPDIYAERKRVEIKKAIKEAERLEKEGKIEEAIKLLERIYKGNERNYSLGIRLGSLYVRIGKREKAHRVFSLLLERYPEDRDIRHLYEITKKRPAVARVKKNLKVTKPTDTSGEKLRVEYVRVGAKYFAYSGRDFEDKEIYLGAKLKGLFSGSLVANLRLVSRFNRSDTQLGLEYYRKILPKWWGYLSSDISPDADFLPEYSLGLGAFRSLGGAEVGTSLRYMNFASSKVLLLIPSIAMYFPKGFSSHTALFINPKRGTYTLLNRLFYEKDRLETFVSFSVGTSSERLEAREDLLRYSTLSLGGGLEYRLSRNYVLGGSVKWENRSGLYKRYGVEGYARYRW